MQRLALAVTAAALALGAPALAQIGRLAPQAAPKAAINPRLQVRPSAVPAPRVPPLTAAAKATAVQQLTDGKAPPGPGTAIHLDIANPTSGGGYLTYNNPTWVFPSANELWMGEQTSIGVTWPASWAPGLRVVDCGVLGAPATVDYDVYPSGGGAPLRGTAPVTGNHLIFVVQATATVSYVSIESRNAGWKLQYCDVTRLG